ncbi:MAG: sialidase family protein [Pyrinomonadaceae bacterium]
MKVLRLCCVLVLLGVAVVGCSRSISHSSPSQNAPSAAPGAGPALIIRAGNSPTGGDSREPDLYSTHDGRIILSWVEKTAAKRYALRTAARDASGWSEARTVAEGENWFVNWADFPSVIALRDGSLGAHWLVKRGTGTYAYDVNIARSKDGGKTWSKPVVPHLDGTETEHGFVSLIPLPDGRVGAIWLDGRNLKDVKDVDEHTALSESMTLRYAAIDAEGKLSDEAQLDDRVCECCQTSAALTSEGALAVYRDRSPAEVRDIYSVRARGDGSWESPRPVHADNWEIHGCPVNGPSVAADGRRVAVGWFTGANDAPKVNLAFSEDAGATFAGPIRVDDGEATGRVDVVLLPDGSALVCWMSGTAEGGAIKVRRIRADGALGEVAVIARTDISRSSGFPRMARLGDEVHFAWTEFGKPSHVRTATADVSAYR